MVRIKMFSNAVKTCAVSMLPILLSFVGVIRHSTILIIFLPVALFIAVALIPYAQKRENIWMFLLVVVSGIPVNFSVIWWLFRLSVFESNFLLLTVFRGVAMYIMLLSIEELILGIITRMIWRKQYKISLSK